MIRNLGFCISDMRRFCSNAEEEQFNYIKEKVVNSKECKAKLIAFYMQQTTLLLVWLKFTPV